MAKLNKEIQEIIDKAKENLYKEEIYINGKHEYDYHKLEASPNNTVHTLYYSDHVEWSEHVRKTIAMQVVDTGNGIEIIGISKKKSINYSEAERLHILLRLSSDNSVYQISETSPKRDF
jgi:hypothetical protein